jgi:hypothetical protein
MLVSSILPRDSGEMLRQASLLCLVPAESLHALHSNQLEHCRHRVSARLNLHGLPFTFCDGMPNNTLSAPSRYTSFRIEHLVLRDLFPVVTCLGASKSAGEPSLKHELAKSLHAGDIATLRTFVLSPHHS